MQTYFDEFPGYFFGAFQRNFAWNEILAIFRRVFDAYSISNPAARIFER